MAGGEAETADDYAGGCPGTAGALAGPRGICSSTGIDRPHVMSSDVVLLVLVAATLLFCLGLALGASLPDVKAAARVLAGLKPKTDKENEELRVLISELRSDMIGIRRSLTRI